MLFLDYSGVFLAYACIILVALLISLSASVTSFVLRESIANRFSLTDVTGQLNEYATDAFKRSRWDKIQHEFGCCGGTKGYKNWENYHIGPLPKGASPSVTGMSSCILRKLVLSFQVFSGSSRSRSVTATLSQVPDSCCRKERPGCGKEAFEDNGRNLRYVEGQI